MSRRARYVPAVALAASVAVAAAAPAGASVSSRIAACNPAGSRTVAANEFARVYTVRSPDGRRAVVCSYSSGRRRALGGIVGSGCVFRAHRVSQVRLAGRMVGYARTECGLSTPTWVIARNVATGRALFSEPATVGPGAAPSSSVTDLELKSTGSIVWIAEHDATDLDRGIDDRQLRVIETRLGRHAATRDRGLDIEPGSLAMSRTGSIAGTNPFYWRKGGTLYSSSLD